MSRLLTIAFALTAACLAGNTAQAQYVAIGEKAPKTVATEWIDSGKPAETEYTCIIFVHSHNTSCIESVRQAAELARLHQGISFHILTREDLSTISPWLHEVTGERVGVAVNADADFERFQIQYAPFAVTVDAKRRVVWFGNPERVSAQTDAIIRRNIEVQRKTEKE